MISEPDSAAIGETAISLTSGVLRIRIDRADWPLDALCDFAARDNPRRAFLVVSRLLGRHIPAAPRLMRASTRDLAARLPADLPGPVLVVGLAETAICLGQSVHEDYRAVTGRDDVAFLHSTRQELDHPLLCRFEEPHSHASTHLIYRPVWDEGLTRSFRSLVLVDDEISTGTTLVNLAAALAEALPALEVIQVATLADWTGPDRTGKGDWLARMPRPARCASLLAGTLAWEAGAPLPPETAPASFDRAALALGRLDTHHNFGRLGRTDIAADADAIADGLDLPPASRIRVVATGEFTYPPFRLGERLEQLGHDVVMQSTTRSPARIDGAIRTRLSFADNYGTAVRNHIYNVDPDDRRLTLICHETPLASVDPALVAALDARVIDFGQAVRR